MSVRLSFFIVLILCLNLHANINNLKDTFDVLKDKYKEFSILNGAIADQTGYIMRLYDYGTLGQMRKASEQSSVLVPDISYAPEIIKLVHFFFYRTPGTIGRGDFVFTRELRSASDEEKEDIIKAIAWIMAQIKKVEAVTVKSRKFGAAIAQSISAINIKGMTIKDEVPALAYLANVESSVSIVDILKQRPDVLKLFKLVWQSVQLEQGSIAQTTLNIKPLFPLFTTNTILLAVVFKLAENNKKLIQAFYEKLNEIIIGTKKEQQPSSIFVDDRMLDQHWADEHFEPAEKQELGEQLSFAVDNIEQLKKHYESIVYLALLSGEYPQRSGYTLVYYHYDPQDPMKAVGFHDCMDNTYRNLFNILFYDKDTISFMLDKIAGIHPNQALTNFYTDNKDASDTEKYALHKLWTQVIENIPFVAYNRKVGNEQSADDFGKKGYVKVSEGIDLGAEYISVGKNSVVYEMQPSIRNIIFVFNYLLGLDLFNGEPGSTPDEKIVAAFMRPDFIKTYFPILCEKIGITFYGFYWADGQRIDEIDKQDYNPAKKPVIIKLRVHKDAQGADVELRLSRGHGQLTVIDKTMSKNRILEWFNANKKAIIGSANNLFDNYFFSLFYVAAYKEATINEEMFTKIDAVHCFNLLFYLPINDSDYINRLIRSLNDAITRLNEYAIYLLSYLCNKIPDENQKQIAKLDMYGIVIRCPKWNPRKGLMNIENSAATVLINVASVAIKSKDYALKFAGLRLFKTLFEKGEGFSEAIQIASETIKSHDDAMIGQDLFKTLFEKGEGFSEAIQLASESIKSEWSFRLHGLHLLRELVNKGRGYPEALQAVSELPKNTDLIMLRAFMDLDDALVDKEKGYSEASKAASAAIKFGDQVDRQRGIHSFKKLFEKKQGYTEASETAAEAIQSAESDKRKDGMDLFRALFAKKQGYFQASQAASAAIKSKTAAIRTTGLDLFKTLFDEGQGYSEAIQAASEAVKSADADVRASGQQLFWEMFGKGKGYSEATQVAIEATKSVSYDVQQGGLYLFVNLVAQEKAYLEALQAALAAANSQNKYVQLAALALFNALVEKEQAYPQAIQAASGALKSNDFSVSDSGKKLFITLIKKEQGYKQVIEAAFEAAKSEDHYIQETGLDLFIILVEKDQEYPEKETAYSAAIQAARLAVKSAEWPIPNTGLKLFIALVQKGQGDREAIQAASDAIRSTNFEIRTLGQTLFSELIQKERGYKEGIQVASEIIQSSDQYVQISGLDLFKELVEKGQGYSEASKAASEATKSKNRFIKKSGLNLSKALVQKGQGNKEVIQDAREAIKSENDDVRKAGLHLFEALLNAGQGGQDAIQAATEDMKSADWLTQYSGLDLFCALLEKGQGYREALQVVSVALKSESSRHCAVLLLKTIFEKLKKTLAEKLTPELREIIKQAIDAGKSVDASTTDGKEILKMAQELEKKIEKKE